MTDEAVGRLAGDEEPLSVRADHQIEGGLVRDFGGHRVGQGGRLWSIRASTVSKSTTGDEQWMPGVWHDSQVLRSGFSRMRAPVGEEAWAPPGP